jgi:hypothetical protein
MGTVRTGELVKYVDSVTSADQFYFDQGAEVPCDDGTTVCNFYFCQHKQEATHKLCITA